MSVESVDENQEDYEEKILNKYFMQKCLFREFDKTQDLSNENKQNHNI